MFSVVNDKRCFLWSILALLHPEQHGNHLTRVLKYQEYQHELNMSGIRYVVDIKDIGKFEHQNDVSVNVYEYEDKNIFPLRIYQRDRCKTSSEFLPILFAWLLQ